MLTQEQLAERAGLSVRTVHGVESGQIRRPRNTSLRMLAEALGLVGEDRDSFIAVARRPPANPGTGQPAGAVLMPAQLPPDLAAFTGRLAEMRSLDRLLPAGGSALAAVPIVTISGAAGIGKTTLAVHWAHRVRHQFPDGQLFLNLRGFDPAGSPLKPGEGIRTLLDALHVPQQRIPATLDAQVGLYRSRLDGKRMLVVLDNAGHADQVRPLLPAADGCMAVVTSRNRLLSLIASEAAQLLPLDLLSREGARTLIARRIGATRVAGEPQATDEIIARCTGLPLALAIVAARAVTNPRSRLGELAVELANADNVLDTMGDPGTTTDLRSVFSWSYRALSVDAARLFRLLSVHPGPDLSTATAASLAGVPLARTARLLAELAGVSLVTEPGPGRYAFHDLLSAYAHELADTVDGDADRREARLRLLDHYLDTADAAARLHNPLVRQPAGARVRPDAAAVPLASNREARLWFEAERAALIAVIEQAAGAGFDSHASHLAQAVMWFLDQAGHWADQLRVQQVAVAAAGRLADATALAHAHRRVGVAHGRLGESEQAEQHLRTALDMFTELDESNPRTGVHSALGALYERQGDYDQALQHDQQALELAYATGHEAAQARCLNAVGWCYALRGEYQQTIIYSEQALVRYQRLDDPAGAAKAWDSLGFARSGLGEHLPAIECYQRALELLDRHDSRDDRVDTLTHLGDSYHAIGDLAAARRAWQAALEILTQLGLDTATAELRAKLQGLANR